MLTTSKVSGCSLTLTPTLTLTLTLTLLGLGLNAQGAYADVLGRLGGAALPAGASAGAKGKAASKDRGRFAGLGMKV